MKIKILTMVIALAALAAGCTNTMRGAGQDIERGGEKIQQKAG
ncbi:entericidin A/B family lipoprotein [Parapusillimonas granuli]|uniref:Entericidin A/B family lipoprotein n=1 Tax=Parapusillimonas granuli TaxID=380911 RepID=A0A853G4B5_9BURK|nr:entericidin A/B family lipoprotein [Parapusillimonas granuli]MBB5216033.1 putative small secreted protein [Parapusillimonas granuli]MEB2401305.1 entericidin A/B family lipoprotein [Alcaligenaceae bacterium]NYT50672.1 entericidin A/B family lipoprotein [Parapusillimonas granuli]